MEFIRKTCLLFLLFWALSAGASALPAAKLTETEARQFAQVALGAHNRGADLEAAPRADDPDFYFFAATWSNPVGSPIIGYFAVNPWTGDVWDRGCQRVRSTALSKLQAETRKRLALPADAYRVWHRKMPIC
jgi:hypothetical protein